VSAIDCAALSLELDEDMAGTAPTERGVLVLEVPGPWGRDVLTESRLGADLGKQIAAKAKRAGLRVQGVRRQHRRYEEPRPHAWIAGLIPGSRFLEAFRLDSPADLLDLDVRPDRPTGHGTTGDDPLYLVCTHSTRDACCARRGLPLAREVFSAAPGLAWHASHLGGHRFAPTMACLPLGAWLGRVAPEEAAEVVALCGNGRLPLAHMRGMAGNPPVAQAAELALRSEFALDYAGDVRHVEVEREIVTLDAHSGRWEVEMRYAPTGRARPFSCGHEAKEEDPGRWTAVRLTPAGA
jgi:hypothetical protein